MFVILQKYDFSSKSQQYGPTTFRPHWCLWYCKSTIFQANHNKLFEHILTLPDVCDTAKVRFFKQITTKTYLYLCFWWMFVILQKYDFSSKSQRLCRHGLCKFWCLWYCKSTIFQANHNGREKPFGVHRDVCDTAKVRFFKQITTSTTGLSYITKMFVILQKYDFSSKSQHVGKTYVHTPRCLWYCKSTIFQANHNCYRRRQYR